MSVVNESPAEPLASFCSLGSLRSSGRYVLSALSQEKQNALMLAAMRGHTECVKYLLNGSDGVDGFDIEAEDENNMTALLLAAENGHDECLEAILAHWRTDWGTVIENHPNAVIIASLSGSAKCVEQLLSCGFDVDYREEGEYDVRLTESRLLTYPGMPGSTDCAEIACASCHWVLT